MMQDSLALCPFIHELILNGKGMVKAKPDIAQINIGVITEDKELKNAQQNNAAITTSVINTLKAAGIHDNDIQTLNYTVSPEYDFVEGRQTFRTYRVVNSLRVTIRNLNQVGEIIDSAVRSGANEIGDIHFTVSDSSEYYNQALNLAIKDAMGKAMDIEKAFGFHINKTPIKITEETSPFTPKMEFTAMRAGGATPIQPGELDVTASVNVVFAYN